MDFRLLAAHRLSTAPPNERDRFVSCICHGIVMAQEGEPGELERITSRERARARQLAEQGSEWAALLLALWDETTQALATLLHVRNQPGVGAPH